jgi:hypothetical protein
VTLAHIGVLCCLLIGATNDDAADSHWETRDVAGWTVRVSTDLLKNEPQATARALELLQAQLEEIIRVVPAQAVMDLKKVSLYLSPEYPDFGAKAEYHPDAGWLRSHGRDPAMEKGIEFTNVLIFERETKRMPLFVLHELAHAYHDRILGNDNADVKAAYKRVKKSGKYDHVDRRDADGQISQDRAYALSNAQEYFAESTEAFFGQNDFFPFNRDELKKHDPETCELLSKLWGVE